MGKIGDLEGTVVRPCVSTRDRHDHKTGERTSPKHYAAEYETRTSPNNSSPTFEKTLVLLAVWLLARYGGLRPAFGEQWLVTRGTLVGFPGAWTLPRPD